MDQGSVVSENSWKLMAKGSRILSATTRRTFVKDRRPETENKMVQASVQVRRKMKGACRHGVVVRQKRHHFMLLGKSCAVAPVSFVPSLQQDLLSSTFSNKTSLITSVISSSIALTSSLISSWMFSTIYTIFSSPLDLAPVDQLVP